jgi:hypothetical protein
MHMQYRDRRRQHLSVSRWPGRGATIPVIAYYLQHQTVVDAYLAERRQRRAAQRAAVEQRRDPHSLRARLLARQASAEAPQ